MPSARGGFTLLELVLAVALLMLMVTSIGFYVGPWLRGAGVEAQASQFAGALRFARAEAAYLGRAVQLTFEPEPIAGEGVAEPMVRYRIAVSYEAQPLAEPHVFVPLHGRAWIEQLEQLDQVIVTQAELIGPDAEALTVLSGDGGPDDRDAPGAVRLMFYPDGSSDWAQLVLASPDPNDPRRGVLTLTGLIGSVSLSWTDAQSLEAEQDLSPSPGTAPGTPAYPTGELDDDAAEI